MSRRLVPIVLLALCALLAAQQAHLELPASDGCCPRPCPDDPDHGPCSLACTTCCCAPHPTAVPGAIEFPAQRQQSELRAAGELRHVDPRAVLILHVPRPTSA